MGAAPIAVGPLKTLVLKTRVAQEYVQCKRKSVEKMLLRLWKALISLILKVPNGILLALDWLIGIVERLMVLAIASMIFYASWRLLGVDQAKTIAAENLLRDLSENWKGLLLLLIPLFYRTVRTFLEKVKKFAGMETETGPPEKQIPESEKNE